MKRFPKRKSIRLEGFDYSQPGAYFITICTHKRKCIFSKVGADSISARIIEQTFLKVIAQYNNVDAPIYTVMPNHFHAIINISRADIESAPTISHIVQEFKRFSTIEFIKLVKKGLLSNFDGKVWQRGFYDHIIRNQDDYNEIFKYIEENPLKWENDRFFEKQQ